MPDRQLEPSIGARPTSDARPAALPPPEEWGLLLTQGVRRELALRWYEFLNRMLARRPVRFLNFGYSGGRKPAGKLRLPAGEEGDRPFLELYHRVLTGSRLRGRRVLEIGCGRGGGASFLARRYAPSAVLGVDRSPAAIAFCRATYRVPGLRFAEADAERLRFRSASFDIAVNVESSHVYGDGNRFLAQVHRVLRPGGRLLIADYRPAPFIAAWEAQFRRAGFQIEAREDITRQVVRSLEETSERRLRLIRQWTPAAWVWLVTIFSGARGSRNFRRLEGGQVAYFCYRLRKARRPSTGRR